MYKNFTRIALITVCFFNLNLEGSAGTLDATFNPAGTPPGTVRYAAGAGYALALQPDGKVIIAGSSGSNSALVRYTSAGALDPAFGAGGVVTTTVGTSARFYGVVVQPDGKIVAAGFATIGGIDNFFVARYNTNGTLDASFGSGGIVTTLVGATSAQAYDLALQSDGKIVVAGRSGGVTQFAVVRYTTTGALDGTFGTGGITTTTISSSATGNALTLQPDGKIVVGGFSRFAGANQFTVVRYDTNGSLDPAFGGTGIVITTIDSLSVINDITMQAVTGKIIAVGISNLAGVRSFTIARYNLNGTLDTSFGVSGIVKTGISGNDEAFGVAIQQNGSIVVSGDSVPSATLTFTLARYTPNGALDTAFGTGGIVQTPYGSSPSFAYDVAIQDNVKIVAAGFLDNALGGARYFGYPSIINVCAP